MRAASFVVRRFGLAPSEPNIAFNCRVGSSAGFTIHPRCFFFGVMGIGGPIGLAIFLTNGVRWKAIIHALRPTMGNQGDPCAGGRKKVLVGGGGNKDQARP